MQQSLRYVRRPGRAPIPIISDHPQPTVLETTASPPANADPTAPAMQQVDAVIRERLSSRVALIDQISHYIINAGGKRIRPRLVLLFAEALGFEGPARYELAAVVEFIHTATLVHDDIIDDAETRRGQKAVHSRWGNDVTVLAGDFLYIKSMRMALTQDTLDVVRLLCDITLRMIEGEIYQLTKNGDVDISEDEHFDIIRRKTAHLFGGCAEIGAMLGEAGPEKQAALRDYGFNLGVLFQLVDDQLDFTGEAEALGKPIGGDLLEGKMTLPMIHLRDHGGPDAVALIRRIVAERYASPDDWARLNALLHEHRSLEYAQARARAFGDAAQRALAIFPDRPEREALLALAEFAISRDR